MNQLAVDSVDTIAFGIKSIIRHLVRHQHHDSHADSHTHSQSKNVDERKEPMPE